MKVHRNNFDLIRLLAALQVALAHGIGHFHVPMSPVLVTLLESFPGVQSFFCISGFLIARSIERNREDLKSYAWSRILRIYPALLVCSTLWLGLMLFLGVFHGVERWKIALWYLGTVTTGGSGINPGFFRGFGLGVWNGALWTVGVELAFYLLLPVLYLMDRRGARFMNRALILLCVASFVLFIQFDGLHWGDTRHFDALTKAVWFSLPGNLWMLLFGTIIHRYFERLEFLLSGKVVWWLTGYLGLVLATRDIATGAGGRVLAIATCLVVRLALALLTISAAYSFRGLGDFLLRGNDISYGLYIYHLPVYNLFIQYDLRTPPWFPLALSAAITCGCASWVFVERRALGLKVRLAPAARPPPRPVRAQPVSSDLSGFSPREYPVE